MRRSPQLAPKRGARPISGRARSVYDGFALKSLCEFVLLLVRMVWIAKFELRTFNCMYNRIDYKNIDFIKTYEKWRLLTVRPKSLGHIMKQPYKHRLLSFLSITSYEIYLRNDT